MTLRLLPVLVSMSALLGSGGGGSDVNLTIDEAPRVVSRDSASAGSPPGFSGARR